MELIEWKITSAFILLTISMFGVSLPLHKVFRKPSVIGYGEAFAGAIFLSASFLELLPESLREYDEIHDDGHGHGGGAYPIPFLLALIGYLGVMMITALVRRLDDNTSSDSHKLFSPRMGYFLLGIFVISAPISVPIGARLESTNEFVSSYITGLSAGVFINIAVEQLRSAFEDDHSMDGDHKKSGPLCTTVSLGELKTRAIILFVVFSIHSFVEGLAIGVQHSVITLTSLLIAVIAHKGVEAFALSLTLIRAVEQSNLVDTPPVNDTTVVGGGVVYGQNEPNEVPALDVSDRSELVQGVQTENGEVVLQEEKASDGFYPKVFLVVLGCSLMAGVITLHPDEH